MRRCIYKKRDGHTDRPTSIQINIPFFQKRKAGIIIMLTCGLVFRLFYKQIFPRQVMVHNHKELFYCAQAEMSSQTKEGANLIKELRKFFKD